jgi:hypothetical protein
LFLLGDLLAKNTASQPVTSLRGGFRNFLGRLDEGDRYTAGGLISPGGSDEELRRLMQKLARRVWRANNVAPKLWSQPLCEGAEPWENPHLPSGYTYLLQFIAHDMVDSVCSATAEGVRLGVANARNRPLALDTIYGSGPDEFPQAYEFDEIHELDQTQLPRASLRVGPRRPATELSTSACPFRDLARGRTMPEDAGDRGNSDGHLREALIVDPRNDDNFIVSQLTVLWHLLHNHVLSLLPPPEKSLKPILNSKMAHAYRRFYCARTAVTLLYRHVIVQDVLPKILHPVVRDHYLSSNTDGSRHWNFQVNPNALQDREEGIPVEFSHGAFRFGHAMVRDRYRLNTDDPTALVIKFTSRVQPGEFFLPTHWLVDWARFFPIENGDLRAATSNRSQRIGPSYSRVLDALQPEDRQEPNSPDFQGLANRELLSASYAGVLSVPKLFEKLVAKKLGHLTLGLKEVPSQPLRAPYDVWRGPIKEWLSASRGTFQPLNDSDINRIVDDPPLLFFVLFEAAYELIEGVPSTGSGATGGVHLGPVGSIIVAETICGALTRHPIAFETAGATLEACLEKTCSVLVGKPHAQVLAGLAGIRTMSDLVHFMTEGGLFEASGQS